jgi:hypothetical protein
VPPSGVAALNLQALPVNVCPVCSFNDFGGIRHPEPPAERRDRSTPPHPSPDRDRSALRPLQREAHHGFVNRADLPDVEGPVREPFAVQHEEIVEDATDHAVGDGHRRAFEE